MKYASGKVLDLEQGSDPWKLARSTRVTASRISDVLAKIKSGEAAKRKDYRAEIIAATLTGVPQEDGFINAEMQWGIDQEPFARGAYEAAYGVLVDKCGLWLHPSIDRTAASPDGVCGDGLLEIKAPKTATHLQYLLADEVPTKYQPQMLWQMACSGAAWVDFVSYDPRLSPELQLFKVRFERDDGRIREMEAEVEIFLGEVDLMLSRLGKLK